MQRSRRYWDRHAASYDRQMAFLERRFFGECREWVCSRASGAVLEVAIGTGLNLRHYPADVEITGVELSPAMLAEARRAAAGLGRRVTLVEGDAQTLRYDDASFDTVVCTFSLCAIPDDRRAVDEMVRVLRPGGRLLLADHVEAEGALLRGVQRLVELYSVPAAGEHYRRRPIHHVGDAGLPIEEHDRFARGCVERLAARKPV